MLSFYKIRCYAYKAASTTIYKPKTQQIPSFSRYSTSSTAPSFIHPSLPYNHPTYSPSPLPRTLTTLHTKQNQAPFFNRTTSLPSLHPTTTSTALSFTQHTPPLPHPTRPPYCIQNNNGNRQKIAKI